jgi:hypothetical protein
VSPDHLCRPWPSVAHKSLQIEQEEITVNIFNRNAETSPSAFTDLSFNRLELGQIITRLNHAGHIVLSVAYNGNVADIVCIGKSHEWSDAVRGQS